MSAPRQVIPGRTYLITRTTRNRRFFLNPDSVINTIVWFCLGMAAALFDVELHAVCCMGNHIHIVCTDVSGQLPRFLHWLFRHIALCAKIYRNIPENFWSYDKPSVVELVSDEAVEQAIAYVLSNPTTAQLHRRSRSWSGVISSPEDWKGKERVAKPPKQFFRKKESCTVRFTVPKMLLAFQSPEEVISRVESLIATMEDDKARELKQTGKRFLGLRGIKQTKHWARPKNRRARKGGEYRNPTIKAVVASCLRNAIERLQEFRRAYREAYEQAKRGEQPQFPSGTWWMVQYGGYEALPAT